MIHIMKSTVYAHTHDPPTNRHTPTPTIKKKQTTTTKKHTCLIQRKAGARDEQRVPLVEQGRDGDLQCARAAARDDHVLFCVWGGRCWCRGGEGRVGEDRASPVTIRWTRPKGKAINPPHHPDKHGTHILRQLHVAVRVRRRQRPTRLRGARAALVAVGDGARIGAAQLLGQRVD
jgi:hypothetical protein